MLHVSIQICVCVYYSGVIISELNVLLFKGANNWLHHLPEQEELEQVEPETNKKNNQLKKETTIKMLMMLEDYENENSSFNLWKKEIKK